MRKKLLILAICLIFLFPFGFAGAEEEKFSEVIVTAEGKTVFSERFYLNPEFIKIEKESEHVVLSSLKRGFSESELLDYLFFDLGTKSEKLFNSFDDIKEEDCITFSPLSENKFFFYPEKSARRVRRKAFFNKICSCVRDEKIVWEIEYEEGEALYNEAELRSYTSLISSFSTYYGSSQSGRKENVRLASKLLSGKVLGRGETLSFNKVVGKRTADRGFKDAKVIVDGAYVEGVGGGVCQVATTFYNSCLRAGLTPVSWARHTLAPSYVPLSFDAMVSESTDLKVKNQTAGPVFFALTADGERLTVKVYGKMEEGVTYEFKSETVETVKHGDFTEETAELFRDGYKSRGYKLVYKDGKLKEKILLREDFYKPYRIGN